MTWRAHWRPNPSRRSSTGLARGAPIPGAAGEGLSREREEFFDEVAARLAELRAR